MSGIFISYRRDDTAGHAGRIYDRLVAHFGTEQVFMDVDTIAPGEDFTRVLAERTHSCNALIAIIGKQWLAARDSDGRRRLDDPSDYVRMEISEALARGIVVMPVLVEGAVLPRVQDLPAPLRKLADRQALSVGDDRFHAEVDDLINALQGELERAQPVSLWAWLTHRRNALIGLCAIAALGTLTWWGFTQRAALPDRALTADPFSGRWRADVASEDGPPFKISLHFETSADRLFGSVDYPTGTGAIHDGVIRGKHVSFATTHVPQFESQEATTHFEGDLTDAGLKLVMQTSQATRRFTAIKQ